MNLEYFDLTSGCLVTDIMHDVLEGKHLLLIGSHIQMKTCIGMAMKETVLMLRQMIYEEEYVTLDDLNSCLSQFELGYMEEADRCTEISAKNLLPRTSKFTLSQSGIIMYLDSSFTV